MDLKNKIQTDFTDKNEIVLPLQKGLHHDFYNLSFYINLFVVIIIVSSGLVNSEYFYSSSAAAYYGFCISVLFFVIGTSFLYSTKNNLLQFKAPILLFGLWCLYALVHYFSQKGTLVFAIYSVILFLLLLKATKIFSSSNFKFKLFFIGIAGIATLESIYCITQYLNLFKSQNKLFEVTGSWNNPNVTAIFLALTVPIFLFLLQSKHKKMVLTSFLSLLIALLLLKCRAAFIGAILSAVVFYSLEYQFISWAKNKKNSTTVKALIILSLLIVIPVSSQLYNAKKASADGRKFIWKVATIMSTEKPVMGYGYGYFEKEYNLYQANYIQNKKATTEELANAGPVIMPHNELIQNTVEGGSIGLILISLFFWSLLFAVKQKNRTNQKELCFEVISQIKNSSFNLAYAGVIAFIGMSMVNSTIQIVPAMCLLVIYAAIICSTLKPLQLHKNLTFIQKNKAFSIFSKTPIIAASLYLLFLIFGMASADRQNKKAKLLKETGHYEKALQIMPDLKPYLKEDSHYWENYGILYFKTQDFQKAIICFKKAQTLSSLPETYLGAGKSYEKLQQYPQAFHQYEILVGLYPSKYSYRMLLLEAYLKNKNTPKAITLAQEIIQLQPKIPSEKVNQYKNVCRILLRKLETSP